MPKLVQDLDSVGGGLVHVAGWVNALPGYYDQGFYLTMCDRQLVAYRVGHLIGVDCPECLKTLGVTP